ncbi:hypothetical protein LINPERHAP2_LOCUS36994, partial [Linum perenne]
MLPPLYIIILNASSGKQRVVREVTIQYNLSNEPWVKYSFSFVAGKGKERNLLILYRISRISSSTKYAT